MAPGVNHRIRPSLDYLHHMSPIFSCAVRPEDGTLSSSALPSPCCKWIRRQIQHFARLRLWHIISECPTSTFGLQTPRRVAHLVSWRLRKTLVQAPERASCKSPDVSSLDSQKGAAHPFCLAVKPRGSDRAVETATVTGLAAVATRIVAERPVRVTSFGSAN